MDSLILQIIVALFKEIADLADDLQSGKIDASKIDLDKVRSGLISLPNLPV